MDILPILATLKRHKTAAGLIVLQVALTCAIVCNALFLIHQRTERMALPTGMPDNELVELEVSGFSGSLAPEVASRADLQALRSLPGVTAATIINQRPFGDNFWVSGVRLKPEAEARDAGAANYVASEGWLETLGLHLVAGRDFTAEERMDIAETERADSRPITAVILNQHLATKLFPDKPAVGEAVYIFGQQPMRVVGVVQTLLSPAPGGQMDHDLNAFMLPVRPNYTGGAYLLRTAPDQRADVLKRAEAALLKVDPKRVVTHKRFFTEQRTDYYRQDLNMAWLMAGVCLALLLVTAVGIVGLASFWVQQRTRMIGTRRALGATRGQILRYFQTENLLLTGIGIVLGMSGAYGGSLALMRLYELPPLPCFYLPIGAVVLFGLGQLAVLAPARRAAALPPVAALRG
ncbi:ABC transporter permease [Ideonella margarita]|uniref:FtsX-like permease family protein n=1 Tax=Ideonella margarita TaxID=2984191 RepID=A0ABU9C6L4_9BURK